MSIKRPLNFLEPFIQAHKDLKNEWLSNHKESLLGNLPSSPISLTDKVGAVATQYRTNETGTNETNHYHLLENMVLGLIGLEYGDTYKGYPCRFAGLDYEDVWASFPILKQVTKKAENIKGKKLEGVFFLEANNFDMYYHKGLNPVIRSQLGLIIPNGDVGFQAVNKDPIQLKEGSIDVIFNNTKNHRAWNRTGQRRVVLCIDWLIAKDDL